MSWTDDNLDAITYQSLSQPDLDLTQPIASMQREAQVPSELDVSRGPWMMVATVRGGGALRPAVLPEFPSSHLDDQAAFSLDLQAASDATTRVERIKKITECLRHRVSNASDPDWALLELLLERVAERTDVAWLDQVQALANVPEAALLLLMRSSADKLADRLTLEEEAPFSWVTLPLSAWKRAISGRHSNLLRQMSAAGLPGATVKKIALENIMSHCDKIVSLRPELSAPIFFALLENFSPRDVMGREFTPPPNPMKTIEEQAERAVKRRLFEGCILPNLRTQGDWTLFNRYEAECHPLLVAPIVAAELVMKARKDWSELAMGLLQVRQIDPIYFETTLPAAVAHLYSKKAAS